MCEPSIETALENNDVNKIKEFIDAGGNIYKELEKKVHFYVRESLMSRACIEKKPEIVEILLDVYERDYKIAEKFVSSENDKEFLLKYIFIAWSEEDISEVLELSKIVTKSSKRNLVFIPKRQDCVIVPIMEDRDLMFRLYKNGLLTINSRTRNGSNPGHNVGIMNRLDLLKRMVAIGLNVKDTLPGSDCDDHNFLKTIVSQTKCIGLIKYCLTELHLDSEDLLNFSAKNKSLDVFEFVLEYLCKKTGSGNKKEFIQKYCENNGKFFKICTMNLNYELLAHLFTVYNLTIKRKSSFFRTFLKEPKASEYIMEILKIEKDNFDDLLDSIEMDVNSTVLDETWRAFDKENLKKINKNNVKIIVMIYKLHQYFQGQTRAFFDMIDPLAIYDVVLANTALFIALELNCEPLIKHLISKGANLLHKNIEGHTALTLACKYCTPEVVRLILRTDSNLINEIGSYGNYPLNELVQRDDSFVGVFKKMVKLGANVHILDQQLNTLLHNAVQSQNIEMVKACLEAGVDPTIKGFNDNTALHLSTKMTLLEIFDLILDTGKVDIETKNYRGNTILHNVCKSYFPYFFFSFVEKTKPNVNALNNDGQSPMYFCFENERFKKLVEMGADTSIVGVNNFPFYTSAAYEWKVDILKECFSRPDIDLTITSNEGETLLNCISAMDINFEDYIQNENVKEMFRKCTNTVTIHRKNSAFQSATETKNLKLLKYMFEYAEPELEHKNQLGETPIFGNLR